MSLAQEIKRLRTAAGLTQAALGEKIGVGQSAIGNLESRRTPSVSVETLYALSDALGVPVDHWRPFLAAKEAAAEPKPKKKGK